MSIKISTYLDTITIGGLLGVNTYSNIENCFAQGLDIEVSNALTLKGIGGIVGVNQAGSIRNSYSTGKIKANKEYVGGIVGYNSDTINKCFSTVNLESNAGYIGGIVGYNEHNPGDSNAETPVKYNLYLGNLYNTSDITNRISGNGSIGKENFGYENQKVTGINQATENIELLSYNEIFNRNIYADKLLWDNSYDYTQLNDSILPKLKNTNTGEVIPNQSDIKLEKEEFVLQNIEIQKNSNTNAEIRLEFTNPNNRDITEINIEGLENTITRNINSNGMTYIDMNVTPIKYWDNYRLSELWYTNNNEKYKVDMSEQIELQFFKEINNYSDWQYIDDMSAENYTLMNDIDFSGKVLNSNLSVGRLEGNNHTLKNINVTIETSGGFIKEIKNSLRNVTFSNINITSSTSGNYMGVIGNNAAEIENVKFENIVIEAPNRNYVACIANNTSDKINNVTLKDIQVKGIGYVAGGITRTNEKDITNITADNVTVVASGNYAGGIIGYAAWTEYLLPQSIKNLTITNSSITGKDYVGGVLGYGRINHMDSINNQVSGASYVGGVTGYAYTNNENSTTTNSIIKGSGSYIGGIAGYHNGLSNVKVYNSKIYGTSANTTKIGGIVGSSGANFLTYGLVVDSIVSSLGSQVGGINGYRGAFYSAVINSTVEGYSEVGGISGRMDSYASTIDNSYTNAVVRATEHSAGGLVGYINNEFDIDSISSSVQTSGVYGASVSGKANVGGLIGKVDIAVNRSKYYSDYVHANVNGAEETTSLGIGSNPNYNLEINKLYAYKNSTINNEKINEDDEIFIPKGNFLDGSDLKDTTTYSQKIGWSTRIWNFYTLDNNQYPNLKGEYLGEQPGIELPTDDENVDSIQTQENTEEQPEQTFEYSNKTIQTYSTYSVITSKDGSKATRNAKLYVKDNTLYAIPIVLASTADNESITPVANNLIIDSYNGKEYETVLGSDGKLYDLKEPITYPENFVNENIESIGNNINSDTKEVEITYKNGDKIKFNYQTGEVISSSKAEDTEKTGIFDYLKEKISKIGDTSASEVSQEIATKYEASKELQTKLEETSVEEAIEKQNIANAEQGTEGVVTTENNVTNNSLKENKYISMYNEETGQYEIYNEEELLDTSQEEVVSENEKIEANNLNKYYASEGETKNTKMGIVWIAISIIGVGIILFVLRKNLKKKNA